MPHLAFACPWAACNKDVASAQGKGMLAGWAAGVLWVRSSRRRRGGCKGWHTGATAVHHNRRGASAGVRADSQDAGGRRSPHHPVNLEHSPICARCKGYTLLETQLPPMAQLLNPCILEQKASAFPVIYCNSANFCCDYICGRLSGTQMRLLLKPMST